MTQGFKNLNKKFSARSQRFQQEFQHLKDPENAFGVRFTAVPMGDKIRLGQPLLLRNDRRKVERTRVQRLCSER